MAQQSKELLDQVESLSKQRNYPVKTDGLNNSQLQELLGELQRAPGAPAPAPGATRKGSSNNDPRLPDGDGTKPPGAIVEQIGDPQPNGGIVANASTDVQRAQREGRDPAAPKDAKQYPFVVAKGKAMSSARGLLEADAGVGPEDVGGSQERLEALEKKGVLVRSSSLSSGDAKPGDAKP